MHPIRLTLLAAAAACAATLSACDAARPVAQDATAVETCEKCHGFPPSTTASGIAHTTSTDCHQCHASTVDASGNVIDTANGGTHEDGRVEVVYSCEGCHGLPPTTGAMGGDHSAHLKLQCGTCHPGYTSTSVNRDLHVNGKPDVSIVTPGAGTVTFSAWPSTPTSPCACHGAPYNVPSN
jgi:hypothetical protein